MPTRIFKIIIVLIFWANTAYAYEDGFGQAKKIEGKYFVVYYAPQVETSSLTQQLNTVLGYNIISGQSDAGDPSPESRFTSAIDSLYLRVCDVLDMRLYSFHGKIKICQDQRQLSNIHNNLFGKELETSSFYVYELNTIYISAEDFKPGVLAHEMGHAVMSHYFVVQPPVKVQEILAGYVEYQFKKR